MQRVSRSVTVKAVGLGLTRGYKIVLKALLCTPMHGLPK